jgi:hypothetical protein
MLLVKVLDHKTMGKDKELGQTHVDVSLLAGTFNFAVY